MIKLFTKLSNKLNCAIGNHAIERIGFAHQAGLSLYTGLYMGQCCNCEQYFAKTLFRPNDWVKISKTRAEPLLKMISHPFTVGWWGR